MRVQGKTGTFWFDSSSFESVEGARWQEQLPTLCATMASCVAAGECVAFEAAAKGWVHTHLTSAARLAVMTVSVCAFVCGCMRVFVCVSPDVCVYAPGFHGDECTCGLGTLRTWMDTRIVTQVLGSGHWGP